MKKIVTMPAIEVFASTVGRSLSKASAGETKAERRVRIIQDTARRVALHDRAGLRIKTADGRETAHERLAPWLETQLVEARRDVRVERGDY